MVYIDTSALVPIFIQEPKSEAVIDWVENAGERLAISEWSMVEFASAAAIKVRTKQITAILARQASLRLYDFAQKHLAIAVPGREEFHRAVGLASNDSLKLRAGDALHLAIAASLNAGRVLCLDQAMAESAKALGMKVVTV